MSAWVSSATIDATVTDDFVIQKISLRKQHILYREVLLGGGLTDDTYLDWIVNRGKRLFMILVDIGCPDNVLDAIDQNYDDSDLPLPESAILDLDLCEGESPSQNKKFFRRQYYYLVQELGAGCHVDYDDWDILPFSPVGKSKAILLNSNVDRVAIGDQVFIRQKIPLSRAKGRDKAHFLQQIENWKKLKHPHLVPVWATYTLGSHAYILLSPLHLGLPLKDLLEHPPKSFTSIRTVEKRHLYARWVYCLTNAIAYLHENGCVHDAIQPSNIFVDDQNNIRLGLLGAIKVPESKDKSHGREAYNHAAPENYQRTAMLQDMDPLHATLPGGGRTRKRVSNADAARTPSSPQKASSLFSNLKLSALYVPPTPKPVGRAALSRSPIPHAMSHSPLPRAARAFPPGSATAPGRPGSRSTPSATPTERSSDSSNSNSSTSLTRPPPRTIINTFIPSTLFNPFAADVYCLSTIHVLLLSCALLSSRFSPSSLTTHLGKRNRSAGRGGAPADVSFHGNGGQVAIWLDNVVSKARKEDSGDNLGVLIKDLVNVARSGLCRNMSERWESGSGARAIKGILENRGVYARTCCSDTRHDIMARRSGTVFLPELGTGSITRHSRFSRSSETGEESTTASETGSDHDHERPHIYNDDQVLEFFDNSSAIDAESIIQLDPYLDEDDDNDSVVTFGRNRIPRRDANWPLPLKPHSPRAGHNNIFNRVLR